MLMPRFQILHFPSPEMARCFKKCKRKLGSFLTDQLSSKVSRSTVKQLLSNCWAENGVWRFHVPAFKMARSHLAVHYLCLVSTSRIKPQFCLTASLLFWHKMAKLGNICLIWGCMLPNLDLMGRIRIFGFWCLCLWWCWGGWKVSQLKYS